jgi:hypothetical protein
VTTKNRVRSGFVAGEIIAVIHARLRVAKPLPPKRMRALNDLAAGTLRLPVQGMPTDASQTQVCL